MQRIWSTFFGRGLQFQTINPNNDSLAEIHSSGSFHGSESQIALLKLLESLTGSSQLHVHISYIRDMDRSTRRLLKDTVVVSELFVAYIHIASAAETLLKTGRYNDDELENLQYGCRLLTECLQS